MVVRTSLLLLALAALVWGDLAWRARRACLEGERFLAWRDHPELQRAAWDAWLSGERERLAAEARAGRMGEDERRRRAELAQAERDERVAENPLKYAVRWFETAVDLFSTPPSPWSRRAASLLPPARARWERELAQAGLRPGETRLR